MDTPQFIDQPHSDLISPKWATICAVFPDVAKWFVSAWVGTLWTFRLIRSHHAFATSLVAIREANSVSLFKALRIFWNSQRQAVTSLLDFAYLIRLSPDEIRKHAKKYSVFRNVDVLETSLCSGRPVILLLSSFSLHYIGLVTASTTRVVDSHEIKVVQPTQALSLLNAMGFYERLTAATERKISGIYADVPAVAVHVGRALKRKQIVAMRIDSLPTKTGSYVIGTFLGRPAAFPLSILELAAKFDAEIIPFMVRKDGRHFLTTFGSPVRMVNSASNVDFCKAASDIYLQMGNDILSCPDGYLAWHAVYEKWRMANEICAAIETFEKENT